MRRRPVPRLAVAALALLGAACGGGGGGRSGGAAYPAGVVRGPQLALPSPTSMTIAWTTTAAVVGAVDYGPTGEYGRTVAEASPRTDHRVTLPDLAAATGYHYRIVDDGTPAGGDHTLRTPPATGTGAVRLVVLGDCGTGGAEAAAAIARVRALAPDVVLVAGDLAYEAGTAAEVRARFTVPFRDVLATTPTFPVLGNHDVTTADGQPTLDAIVLPTNPQDGTSRFYAFDWGPVHVACLDSNASMAAASPQGTWLRADLGATTARWKVVMLHHPAYSSSTHGSTAAVQTDLVPVCDAYDVDLVVSGHDHDYERTHPLLAGVPTTTTGSAYVDPAGTVYVVTGGGGRELYPSGTSAFTAFSASVFHVTRLDASPTTLALTAVRTDGTVLDTATITKTP